MAVRWKSAIRTTKMAKKCLNCGMDTLADEDECFFCNKSVHAAPDRTPIGFPQLLRLDLSIGTENYHPDIKIDGQIYLAHIDGTWKTGVFQVRNTLGALEHIFLEAKHTTYYNSKNGRWRGLFEIMEI